MRLSIINFVTIALFFDQGSAQSASSAAVSAASSGVASAASSGATPAATSAPAPAASSGSPLPDGQQAEFKIDGPPVTYPLGKTFCNGTQYTYVDFGKRSIAYGGDIQPTPVWIIVSGFDQEGRPLLLDGQRVVFDHLPGQPDYSDLKRVNYIVVPNDYKINTHTDAKAIRENFTATTAAGRMFVNYPVVTLNSKVENGMVAISKGWYKGKEVHYFDMGLNPGNSSLAYQPINNDGKAQGLPVVSAQPGTPGYTSFWKLYDLPVPDTVNRDSANLTTMDGLNIIKSTLTSSTKNDGLPYTFTVVNRPLLALNATPMVGGGEIAKKDEASNLKGNGTNNDSSSNAESLNLGPDQRLFAQKLIHLGLSLSMTWIMMACL